MSQKKVKQQRRQIKKASNQIVKNFLKHVKEGWNLQDRLWLAWKIIFKGKLAE